MLFKMILKFSFIFIILVNTFFVNYTCADLLVDPWHMFRNNIRHTGKSIYKGTDSNKLKWKFKTGGFIESSPAIDVEGSVYVGTSDGKVYAFRSDGSIKWTYQTQNWIESSPAIGWDGTIYIGSNDKHLYAIGD